MSRYGGPTTIGQFRHLRRHVIVAFWYFAEATGLFSLVEWLNRKLKGTWFDTERGQGLSGLVRKSSRLAKWLIYGLLVGAFVADLVFSTPETLKALLVATILAAVMLGWLIGRGR